MLDAKKYKKGCSKEENLEMLRTNNDQLEELLKKALSLKQKAFTTTILTYIKQCGAGGLSIKGTRCRLKLLLEINCRNATSYGLKREEYLE